MAVADQVAGDLDHLLMADPQLADQGVRVDGIEPTWAMAAVASWRRRCG
jgi:hypothetical protein